MRNCGSHVQFVLNVVCFVVVLCVVLPHPLRGMQGPGEPAGDRRFLTGERGGRETQRVRASFPSTPAPAPRRPALAPFRPAASLFRTWRVDQEDVDGGEARDGDAGMWPRPPRPPSPSTSGGTMASPWFAAVPPRHPGVSGPPPAAGLGQHRLCPAPLVGLLPGVLHLRDLLAGASRWWHCVHRPEDERVWITAVERPGGPKFGTKGATMGQALQSQVLYAHAPLPDPRNGCLPYT